MKKVITLFIALIVFMTNGYSQVNYTFSSSSSIFSAITGSTFSWTGTVDDAYSTAENIGFTFNYAGTNYTQIQVSTNGFIRMGTGLVSSIPTDALSGTVRSIIAPLWDDLSVTAFSDITFELNTDGGGGNYVLTVEWKNIKWNKSAGSANAEFQVKLYEATGNVEFIYGTIGTPNAGSASIGLSDNTVISTANSATNRYLSVNIGVTGGVRSYHQSRGYTFNGNNAAPDANTKFTFTKVTPSAIAGGTYTVGAGQDYNTLSEAAQALNINGISGAIVLGVASGTYDDIFHLIDVAGTSITSTITLQKADGAVTLSPSNGSQSTSAPGTTAGDAVIRLDGTDYVTINGLNILQNVGNTTAAKKFNMGISLNNTVLNSVPQSGAQNNTFKNMSIDLGLTGGLTAGLIGIRFGTSGTTTGAFSQTNSFNTIQDVTITGFHASAIKMFGHSVANPDSGNTITAIIGRNTIGNVIGGIGSDTRTIEMDCQSTITIEKTDITNISNTINTTNHIYGLVTNLAGSASNLNRGVFIIRNNTFSNLSNGGSGVTSGFAYGIGFGASNNSTVYEIYNNKFNNIYSNGSTTSRAIGLQINGSTTTDLLVKIHNNMVSDIRAPRSTSAPGVRGFDLQNAGGTGTLYVYNNTVVLDNSESPTASAHNSACLYFASMGSSSLDVRNNIFINTMSSATGKATVLMPSANSNYLRMANTSDFNLYYSGSSPMATQGISWDFTTFRQTLAEHQAAVASGGLGGPRDVNAVSKSVNFTSSTDLHLTGASLGDNELIGTVLSGYTTDIDGNTRNAYYPYKGADESISNPLPVTNWTASMSSSLTNAQAFGTTGLIGTDGSTSFYAHWDATYLYLGWSGGKTNYSSDMYFAAIDTDPSGTTGTNDEVLGVSFQAGDPRPDYYVAYENNSSFYGVPATEGNSFELYNGTGGTWNWVSRTAGDDGTASQVNFTDSDGEVRLRLPWASLGSFTPAEGTKLGIVMWNNNANGNYMWGRVPTSNPVNGSTPKTLTMQFVYNNTGSGINPSTNRTETPLPVELTSFNANAFGKDVKLNWSTSTEVNSHQFVVEKNENEVWNAIGSVNAAGNSNSPKVYSFTDNNLQPGKYQYRLKMIDNDGSYEYSSSVEVDIDVPKEFALMQNYPNPFNPVTNINYTIPVDSKVMLVIYSISGEKVAELVNESQAAGNYSIPFNASHLASGTYVYRLIANDFVQTKKMLLIK
jgi:hypothetical protein